MVAGLAWAAELPRWREAAEAGPEPAVDEWFVLPTRQLSVLQGAWQTFLISSPRSTHPRMVGCAERVAGRVVAATTATTTMTGTTMIAIITAATTPTGVMFPSVLAIPGAITAITRATAIHRGEAASGSVLRASGSGPTTRGTTSPTITEAITLRM